MKTRKTYIIVEVKSNKILHTTSDRTESMKIFDIIKKTNTDVVAQCVYQ